MVEFSLQDKSEYSMDFSLFYRIDYLFQRLDMATLNLNLYLWYNLILVLYKEVAPLIIDTERDHYKHQMEKFLPDFIEIKKAIEETGNADIPLKLYQDLQDFEISLRDVVNKRGLYLRLKGGGLNWQDLLDENEKDKDG